MENKITQELIEKVKEAKSVEEILTLAKDNGIEMSEEEAKAYYEQFHKTGELSDDELDNVAGGGCQAGVDDSKYTIVTSHCNCFTGQYEHNYVFIQHGYAGEGYEKTTMSHDRKDLRDYWKRHSSKGECGQCGHLQFIKGTCTGYCDVTGK